jgi:single-strand DNA-binding protein
MNSFNGIGRIGMDPELKDVGGGHQKLGLRVAFNRRVKVDGSWTEKASWVSVTLWDKRATALEPYLRKGTQIGVEGELDVHEYEKRDGGKGVEVRIENANVHLLGKGDGGQKRSEFSGGGGGGGGGGSNVVCKLWCALLSCLGLRVACYRFHVRVMVIMVLLFV